MMLYQSLRLQAQGTRECHQDGTRSEEGATKQRVINSAEEKGSGTGFWSPFLFTDGSPISQLAAETSQEPRNPGVQNNRRGSLRTPTPFTPASS